MAKKSGNFLALAAVIGAVAAGVYYCLQRKKQAPSGKADDDSDDFSEEESVFDDSDFDDTDLDDDDFDEEPAQKNDHVFQAGTNKQGHTYVTLDLKAAQNKAVHLRDNVANKVGEAVNKLKSTNEYETVTGKINEAVSKIKNSNEFHTAEDHLENALHRVKEATEKAVGAVGEAAGKEEAESSDSNVIQFDTKNATSDTNDSFENHSVNSATPNPEDE